ncbi:hypothetical protein DFH11DRAFT_1599306 [Phellopilus nigrolimitatus]|nr:hypothetical protein DFH11DRAFT_1599306 [Phellopilus nigrolimitatus]
MVVTAGEFAQETAFLPDSDSGGSEDTDPPARKVCSRRTPPVAVDDDDDLWSDNGSIVLSRRQEKQIAELPIFQEHGDYSDANDEASDDAPPAAAIAQDMDLSELAWPESARLVQRTTFRVKPQNEHIQKVVLTAKEALAKHIQLATPFPTAEQKDKIAIEVLTEAALVNHEGDIHHRLTEDDDFLVALAKLIRNHMNKVRNVVLTDGIKTIVKNEYAISDKRETATIQINALLRNHAYVHADHNNQSPKTLFTAPAIKILATKSLFMKDGCTHDRFPECFKSGVHPSQNEIPGPVIALISTAIFYVLSDYHRAANHFAPDFSAPRCIHAYGEHMKSLARMYAASKVKYHKVLHALYKDAVENSSGIVHNDDCYADELDGWSCYSDGDGDDGDGCE